MRLFGTKKWDYYSLFGMEEKVEKYCPKIFGTEETFALIYLEWRGKMKIDYPKIFVSEEVLKTQFHHAK